MAASRMKQSRSGCCADPVVSVWKNCENGPSRDRTQGGGRTCEGRSEGKRGGGGG